MIKRTTYGYTAENDNYFLDIEFFDHDIIRFVYSKEKSLPKTSSAVIAEPRKLEVSLNNNIVETSRLKIVIDEKTLRVKIYDLEGQLLSEDLDYDLDVKSDKKIEKCHKLKEAKILLKKKKLWETGIYGTGEKYGFLNKLGTKMENWCSDVLAHTQLHNPLIDNYHTSIPFYIGADLNKSYGIYFDNTFRTYFDFAKEDQDVISFRADGGKLDYYFIYGATTKEVVQKYSEITGKMPLPDIAYLGYQQCRWSYKNRDELLDVAIKMRENKIPCDVLYLDIDYMDNYKVFTIDSVAFKDFKKLALELKKMNFKLVVIIDPGVKVEKGYSVYDEGIDKDYFVKMSDNKSEYIGEVWPGKSVFPDFMQEKVRIWWGELHRNLIEQGIDGIWNDMNEPADMSNDCKTLPEDCKHKTDENQIFDHSEIHNLYGFLEAEATYNGLEKIQENKRPFILTRAAFAGSQRYAALWTGDNASIWEHLEMSIPMFLNLGLSGYSFVGGDVGGFIGETTPELLIRWNQLGAFTPFYRNHSACQTTRQEPWAFGKETMDILRQSMNQRYELIYHFYNLAYESYNKGIPMLRPVFLEYQKDPRAYDLHEQFLLGENIMVCPVVRPGIKKKMIYLPEGQWFDYYTHEIYEGKQYHMIDIEIDKIPVFVLSASAILRSNVNQFVSDIECENLNIEVYDGSDFEKIFYFDDGNTRNYEDGTYSLIKIKLENHKIEIEPVYNGFDMHQINVNYVFEDSTENYLITF